MEVRQSKENSHNFSHQENYHFISPYQNQEKGCENDVNQCNTSTSTCQNGEIRQDRQYLSSLNGINDRPRRKEEQSSFALNSLSNASPKLQENIPNKLKSILNKETKIKRQFQQESSQQSKTIPLFNNSISNIVSNASIPASYQKTPKFLSTKSKHQKQRDSVKKQQEEVSLGQIRKNSSLSILRSRQNESSFNQNHENLNKQQQIKLLSKAFQQQTYAFSPQVKSPSIKEKDSFLSSNICSPVSPLALLQNFKLPQQFTSFIQQNQGQQCDSTQIKLDSNLPPAQRTVFPSSKINIELNFQANSGEINNSKIISECTKETTSHNKLQFFSPKQQTPQQKSTKKKKVKNIHNKKSSIRNSKEIEQSPIFLSSDTYSQDLQLQNNNQYSKLFSSSSPSSEKLIALPQSNKIVQKSPSLNNGEHLPTRILSASPRQFQKRNSQPSVNKRSKASPLAKKVFNEVERRSKQLLSRECQSHKQEIDNLIPEQNELMNHEELKEFKMIVNNWISLISSDSTKLKHFSYFLNEFNKTFLIPLPDIKDKLRKLCSKEEESIDKEKEEDFNNVEIMKKTIKEQRKLISKMKVREQIAMDYFHSIQQIGLKSSLTGTLPSQVEDPFLVNNREFQPESQNKQTQTIQQSKSNSQSNYNIMDYTCLKEEQGDQIEKKNTTQKLLRQMFQVLQAHHQKSKNVFKDKAKNVVRILEKVSQSKQMNQQVFHQTHSSNSNPSLNTPSIRNDQATPPLCPDFPLQQNQFPENTQTYSSSKKQDQQDPQVGHAQSSSSSSFSIPFAPSLQMYKLEEYKKEPKKLSHQSTSSIDGSIVSHSRGHSEEKQQEEDSHNEFQREEIQSKINKLNYQLQQQQVINQLIKSKSHYTLNQSIQKKLHLDLSNIKQTTPSLNLLADENKQTQQYSQENQQILPPMDYYDEFMSKIDEFSISWRDAALQELKKQEARNLQINSTQ